MAREEGAGRARVARPSAPAPTKRLCRCPRQCRARSGALFFEGDMFLFGPSTDTKRKSLQQLPLYFAAIHRVIPKAVTVFCIDALTCGLQTTAYHRFQILAFGSARCGDRQGRIDLDVARYRRRIMWKIGSWFRAAGSSARNVAGERKLARHDSCVLAPRPRVGIARTVDLGAVSRRYMPP